MHKLLITNQLFNQIITTKMKKLNFLALLSLCSTFLFAAQPGCDYWIKANGQWGQSQTQLNKKCEDLEFTYPDGTPIPEQNIMCCDFDSEGNYTGTGINCDGIPAGSPKLPEGSPYPNDPVILGKRANVHGVFGRLHGNWSFDSHLKIATDKTGDLAVFHTYINKKLALLNIEQQFGNKPINIAVNQTTKEFIEMRITPLEGKTSKLDTTGSTYLRYSIQKLKEDYFSAALDDIVLAAPNPVKQGSDLKVELKQSSLKAEISVYANDGSLVAQQPLNNKQNDVNMQGAKKGLYHVVYLIEGVKVKGGLIEVN